LGRLFSANIYLPNADIELTARRNFAPTHWFRTAAGSPQKLSDEAARRGRRWLHGIGPMRGAVG
jgi:hypothetical protein